MFLHYHAGLIFIQSIRRGKTRALVKLCGRVPRYLVLAKKKKKKNNDYAWWTEQEAARKGWEKISYDIRHPGTQSIQVPLEYKSKTKFTL